MWRRTPAGSSVTSRPTTRAVPAVGCSSVVSMRRVVDLPAPLGPSTATISPFPTSRSRARTASTVSLPTRNERVRPRASIMSAPLGHDSTSATGPPSRPLRPHPDRKEEQTGAVTDPTTRVLELLGLLQTHRFWPGPELAGRLAVSERTLRRDIDRLRALGYPVDATPGAAGGYRLAAGAHMPPLLLDDDEAVAIAVGLRAAAGASIAGIEETSVRALAKLEQVLPDRLRRRVGAVHGTVVPLRWGGGAGPLIDPEALAVLSQACRDREQARFDYQRRDGEAGRR